MRIPTGDIGADRRSDPPARVLDGDRPCTTLAEMLTGDGATDERRWHTGARRLLGRRRSRLLINAITILVTLLFSYVAFRNFKVDATWPALRASDYWWLIPALISFGLGCGGRALRWRSLFAPGRRPTRGVTRNAMMIGYFYNNILPARAGEGARILVLTRRSNAPPVEVAGTVVLERIYDLVAVLVIFFVAEPWLPHLKWFGAAAVVAIALVLAIGATASILTIYGDRPLHRLLRPLGRFSLFPQSFLDRLVSELAHGLSGLKSLPVAGEAFVWTITAWLCSMACAYFVTLAFHLALPFGAGVLVVVAVGLGMIIPHPPRPSAYSRPLRSSP